MVEYAQHFNPLDGLNMRNPCTTLGRPPYLEEELFKIAKYLFWRGKGILGTDESISTIARRFQCVGLANDFETRRRWRLLLFTTPNLTRYVSGIVLHPEAVLMEDDNGVKFVELLRNQKILSGVKLDGGMVPLESSPEEPITVGLEELAEKCEMFKTAGVHFAKWRCVFRISKNTPTPVAIENNARILAKFAAICQGSRMVPLIEPDIEQDGTHSLNRMQKVTETIIAATVKAMHEHSVFFEGAMLKVNFITPGMRSSRKYTVEEMAACTVEAIQRTVPPALQGITFLAGSLKEEEATDLLNAVVTYPGRKPWSMTFSFSRGLYMSAMDLWRGNPENLKTAQEQLTKRIGFRLELSRRAVTGVLKTSEEEDWKGPAEEGELYIPSHPFYPTKTVLN